MMNEARTFEPFCRCTGLGIDVSKASLAVVGVEGETLWRREIANMVEAIEALAKSLREGGYRHKIVCESTGHYHLLLGLIMARHGLDLRIINPLQSRKHQRSRVRKTKTDGIDAYVLATMCETERDLPAAPHLQPTQVLMRLKQGQLHALDKQLQRLTRSVNAYAETYAQLGLESSASAVALQQVITALKAAKRHLQSWRPCSHRGNTMTSIGPNCAPCRASHRWSPAWSAPLLIVKPRATGRGLPMRAWTSASGRAAHGAVAES